MWLTRHAATLWRRDLQAAWTMASRQSARHRGRSFRTAPARRDGASDRSACSSSQSSFANASEISHFDSLASEWWNPNGSSRFLHRMNPLRHDFIRACRLSSPQNEEQAETGVRYLDVGCGGGIFAESAARLPHTHSVTALDASAAVLSVARAHAKKDPVLACGNRLVYTKQGVEALAPSVPAHDVVCLFEVLEHVDRPADFLDACMRHVRLGGWLVGSTIARTWLSWVTTKFVAESLLGIVPKGTHDWNKYVNHDELRTFFRGRQGWSAMRIAGIIHIPGLGWKMLAGSEEAGNYFFGVQRTMAP